VPVQEPAAATAAVVTVSDQVWMVLITSVAGLLSTILGFVFIIVRENRTRRFLREDRAAAEAAHKEFDAKLSTATAHTARLDEDMAAISSRIPAHPIRAADVAEIISKRHRSAERRHNESVVRVERRKRPRDPEPEPEPVEVEDRGNVA
jgi:hypothetical protein